MHDDTVEQKKNWVLENIPADPTNWIASIKEQEFSAGNHPGRMNGPLARAAERCLVANRQFSGMPTRSAALSRQSNDERLENYVMTISRIRPLLSK
ncbi:hypothetical protein ACUH97_04365 [Dermabacteraceae bacterium P13088]